MDPITLSMLMGGLQQGGNILGSIFGGNQQDEATNRAISQFKNLDPRLTQMFSKYMGFGNDAGGTLANDMSGYQQSDAYHMAVSDADRAARNAAARGGTLGTYAHQEPFARTSMQLGSQDRQQYLNNLMGMRGMGLNATNSLGQMLGTNASNLASMFYQQGQDQAANTGGLFSSVGKAIFG